MLQADQYSARDSAHTRSDWLDTLGTVHMFPFFIGGLIFVPLGAAMAIFRNRWSALSSRLENYANVPEAKRRAKPLNYLVVGIVWTLVGVAWIILALLNQPWR